MKKELTEGKKEVDRMARAEEQARARVEEIEEALRESGYALEEARLETEGLRTELAVSACHGQYSSEADKGCSRIWITLLKVVGIAMICPRGLWNIPGGLHRRGNRISRKSCVSRSSCKTRRRRRPEVTCRVCRTKLLEYVFFPSLFQRILTLHSLAESLERGSGGRARQSQGRSGGKRSGSQGDEEEDERCSCREWNSRYFKISFIERRRKGGVGWHEVSSQSL